AIAATGLANFTLWARSQLLDDQTFTRTTTSVLDNAAVRDVLASRITDAVMTQVPTQYVDQRPTVEAGVPHALATPGFAPRRALRPARHHGPPRRVRGRRRRPHRRPHDARADDPGRGRPHPTRPRAVPAQRPAGRAGAARVAR